MGTRWTLRARVALLTLTALPAFADPEPPAVGRSGTLVEADAFPEADARRAFDGFAAEGGTDLHVLAFNEPTIAVNPTDPNNVAIADLGLLRVSTDGGASFSPPVIARVPSGYAIGGDPSLAFDSQGRLFRTYLGRRNDLRTLDVFIAQADPRTGATLPGYPVNVSAASGFPASLGNDNDKEWLAIDRFPGSPFQDRIYVAWSNFSSGVFVQTTYSTDQGRTWSSALSFFASGFPWPVHNAVAPDGTSYLAFHVQSSFFSGASGRVVVARSSDGGVSFPALSIAFAPGDADITFNVQGDGRELHGSASWTQGSAQPWVVPHPTRPGHVSVVAADDPTNTLHGPGFDDMNVYLVRSTDRGATWSAPVQVDSGPVGTTQFFPTAAIADDSGCLTVAWWDTRAGATNPAGHFLLDFLVRGSADGGIHFGPEIQINDVPFDPDQGAPDRFPPTGTLRIGEYNGVAVAGATAHMVWTGNLFGAQAGFYDNAMPCEIAVEIDIKPGSDSNPLNPSLRGIVPVALLGSQTFDVTDVDPDSLVFGPNGAGARHEAVEDVNGDGLADLVSHHPVRDTGIAPGDTQACLRGATSEGVVFQGCDAVRTVPDPRCGLGVELGLVAPLLARRWQLRAGQGAQKRHR